MVFSSNETINGIAICIPRRSLTNSLPWIGLGIFLVISGYLTTIKIPCLKNLVQVGCVMKDPQTEKSEVEADIETVITIYET